METEIIRLASIRIKVKIKRDLLTTSNFLFLELAVISKGAQGTSRKCTVQRRSTSLPHHRVANEKTKKGFKVMWKIDSVDNKTSPVCGAQEGAREGGVCSIILNEYFPAI